MRDAFHVAAGISGVAIVTLIFTRGFHVANTTTVALTFLMLVLVVAATNRFWVAAVTSLASLLCFNYFFIPPVGTLTVADPENWVALAAFLGVSLVGSNLSAAMRERERRAIERLELLQARKQAEIATQREALTSALLASIGHDLRTPLTALRIAATNLHSHELGARERAEQTDVVLSEVGRLTKLFENILEMARIDAQAIAIKRHWVYPSEIYEAARDQIADTLAGHSVQLSLHDSELVLIDPRLTSSALARVLENAAQYSPREQSIAVVLKATGEGFLATVADRGPGIPPDDLPRLFERFYRGKATAPRVQGTGMGLAIARGLLLAEGGRIFAASREDGGSVFTIVVPSDRRPRAAEAAS